MVGTRKVSTLGNEGSCRSLCKKSCVLAINFLKQLNTSSSSNLGSPPQLESYPDIRTPPLLAEKKEEEERDMATVKEISKHKCTNATSLPSLTFPQLYPLIALQ